MVRHLGRSRAGGLRGDLRLVHRRPHAGPGRGSARCSWTRRASTPSTSSPGTTTGINTWTRRTPWPAVKDDRGAVWPGDKLWLQHGRLCRDPAGGAGRGARRAGAVAAILDRPGHVAPVGAALDRVQPRLPPGVGTHAGVAGRWARRMWCMTRSISTAGRCGCCGTAGSRSRRLGIPHAGHPITGYLAEVGLLQSGILDLARGCFDGAAFTAVMHGRDSWSRHSTT